MRITTEGVKMHISLSDGRGVPPAAREMISLDPLGLLPNGRQPVQSMTSSY
jgi:hypothetical protein